MSKRHVIGESRLLSSWPLSYLDLEHSMPLSTNICARVAPEFGLLWDSVAFFYDSVTVGGTLMRKHMQETVTSPSRRRVSRVSIGKEQVWIGNNSILWESCRFWAGPGLFPQHMWIPINYSNSSDFMNMRMRYVQRAMYGKLQTE